MVFSHHLCDYCGARIDREPVGYEIIGDETGGEAGQGEREFEAQFAVSSDKLRESPFVFCCLRNRGEGEFPFCELKLAAELASASPQDDHWFCQAHSFVDAFRAARIRMLKRLLVNGELTLEELNLVPLRIPVI